MTPKNDQITLHDNQSAEAIQPTSQAGSRPHTSRFAVDSLQRKERADSFFAQLTWEQQDTLADWLQKLSLSETLRRVAAPPPEGFGIETHLTTLARLRTKINVCPVVHLTQQVLDAVDDMETLSDFSQSERIQKAISHVLHLKTFELSRQVPGDETLPRLLSSIEKLSALEYKRQKLVLEREKLKTNRYHRVDLNIVPPQPREPSMKTVTAEPPPPLPAPGPRLCRPAAAHPNRAAALVPKPTAPGQTTFASIH